MADDVDEIISCLSFVIRKTFWSFWIFLKFVTLRLLDLLGLIFNLLACLTIVRLPCMLRQFAEMDSMEEWRYIGLVHCFIFLMDIPVILMFLMLVPFTFGIPLIKDIQSDSDVKCDYTHKTDNDLYFGGFRLRELVFIHFTRLLADLFCIPFAVIVLLSWRSCRLIKILKEADWEKMDWRLKVLLEFSQLFLDIPCILLGLVILPTWQFYFFVKGVIKMRSEDDEDWNIWRFLTFKHFFLLLVDIICLIVFVITCLTWRGPIMIVRLKNEDKDAWDVRGSILKEFVLIFVDIPFILCGLVVVGTLWRIPKMIRNVIKHKKHEWDIRLTLLTQCAMVFVDLLCFLVGLIVFASVWRTYPLIRDILKYWRRGREDTPNPDGENVKKGKPISWKIRLSVVKHFLLLMVDIPALLCSLILFVTLVRFPKYLAKLLQSSDFYMEFALTTYNQMFKLLVDFVFLIIFLILVILHPVQAWIELLEDDNHRRNRLLKHHRQWVPDIVKKRFSLYQDLDEHFNFCIKNRKSLYNANTEFRDIVDIYLKEFVDVYQNVKGLDGKYEHLLITVIWWESRRVHKLARLYMCETNYIVHPNVALHNENLTLHRQEMVAFEGEVTDAYKRLQDYQVPDVPLWTESSGLSTRSRTETQKVIINCLPRSRFLLTFLIFLNLLPLYRFPSLVVNLWKRWYDRKRIIYSSCKEYLEDLKTILLMLLVLVLVYRAPFLIVDVIYDVFYKHSWKAVRATVRRYPPMLFEDFCDILSFIFSWRSLRFLVTAALFGVLMPASLFLRIAKFAVKSKCFAYLIAFSLYLVFTSFPFIFSFHIGHSLVEAGNAAMVNKVLGGFVAFLMFCLIILVLGLVKKLGSENVSGTPMPYHYVRFNFSNTHAVISEVLEFLQTLALVFSITNLPFLGSDVFHTISNYLLLNFASFEFKLWVAVLLFVIWFFSCGAPVILEEILDELPKQTCAKHPGWRLLLSIFANTLFVTITESLCTLLSCDYDYECNQILNTTIFNTTDNATSCTIATLVDSPAVVCWEGRHSLMAMLGLWGLVWYSSTALLFGIQYGDANHPQLDLKFSPLYDIFINILKACMVCSVILSGSRPLIALSLLVFLSMSASFCTLYFKQFGGGTPSNSSEMLIFRTASFLGMAVVAGACIAAVVLGDDASLVPVWVMAGGLGVIIIVAVILIFVCRQFTPTEKTREDFQDDILALEKKLYEEKKMVVSWSKQRKKWRKLAANVKQAHKHDFKFKESDWSKIDVDSRQQHGTQEMPLPDSNEYHPPPGPPPTSEMYSPPPGPPPPTSERYSPPPGPPPPTSEMYSPPPGPPPPTSEMLPSSHQIEDYPPPPGLPPSNELYIPPPKPPPRESDSLVPNVSFPINETWSQRDLRPFVGIVDTIHVSRHTKNLQKENSCQTVDSLTCNGQNLLVVLQDNIHYTSFSFSFIAQLPLWKSCVSSSNWEGLSHCLTVLSSNLMNTFNTPTPIDIGVLGDIQGGFTLEPDTELGRPDEYVEPVDESELLRETSPAMREQALEDLSQVEMFGDELKQLFDKLLPTLPVIKEWNCEKEVGVLTFELVLSRSLRGTITELGPKGVKVAKGAVITLKPRIKGFTTSAGQISFIQDFEPMGKKGPFKAVLNNCSFEKKNEKLYIVFQGKKAPFRNVIDSLQKVEWK